MRTNVLIPIGLALFLCTCSFRHSVLVENRTVEPVTIAYKVNNVDMFSFFTTRPGVMRKHGKETAIDTTIRMNPADSVVTITLAPGERAGIAHCTNCTYENMSDGDAGYPYLRMNLVWFKVTRKNMTTTYTPLTLMQLAKKKKIQRTLFVIGEDV